MICPNCGAEKPDRARFCPDCGSQDSRASESDEETCVVNTTVAGSVTQFNAPLVGKTIENKYQLEKRLGAGGMGTVYCAKRLMIGDEVAVKILHSEQNDPNASQRFRREAQAAARLKHPNAVNIYDFGITDDGFQYLVMELIEGESLRKIIKQQGPVTPSASVEIVNQVCAALDEAHRHSIIHRDIKPDNIIVNVTTTGLRVKVLDFGIAKLRDDAVGNLTQTGSIVGTPHYMSPEQCLGEELDNRADIYSLGVVLYEMLTGTVPFNSPTPAAVVVQHVNQAPAPLHVLNASITPFAEKVVLHALEKQRELRPQSAGAFAQELSDAVKDHSSTRNEKTVDYSAYSSAPNPTVVLQPQSFSGGLPTSRDVSRDTLGTSHQGNTVRTVGLTVLATVVLLTLGGLAFRLLSNSTRDQSNAPSANASIGQKNESLSSTDKDRAASQTMTAPAVRTPAPQANVSSLRNEVIETLNGWAAAARAHDLDSQMSYYAANVDPYFLRHNVSSSDVRANRSLAYTRYYKLDVQLSNIDISVDSSASSATAVFDKAYSFEGEKYLSGSVKSMLWLTKNGSRWLISGERDLKVYYVNK